MKQFLLGLVFIAIFSAALQAFGEQQPVYPYTWSTTNSFNAIRSGVDDFRNKQQSMNTELYTTIGQTALTSCFSSESAFNACFSLDWQAVDASGFNGNLTTSDNTLQEIAQKVDDLVLGGGSMTWPSSAGIAVYGGSSTWGSSLTLDTELSTVSASDDSIPSAKATKTALDLKASSTNIAFVAGALSDIKIITTAQPVDGEPLIDATVAYGATEDHLRLWPIEEIGNKLALKLSIADIDDTAVNGETSAPISSNWAFDHAALSASDIVVGHVELATTSETTTGTSTGLAVTPDGLSGSVYGQKEIGWAVVASDVATAVADGKEAAVVPASMNGMNLTDLTCAVHDLNSAASGTTTIVLRRVRGNTAVDMTSTGVTISHTEYTASDETVDTLNDDLQTGDKLYIDITAITTAAHKGLGCTAVFQTP